MSSLNMYRHVFTIWILLSSVEFITAQNNNVDGIYYNTKNGDEVLINRNNFYFKKYQANLPMFHNDTLARCTFEWVDDEFIVLNSSDRFENCNNLAKNTRIVQTYDSTIAEGLIKLVLTVPTYYYYTDFYISIHSSDSSYIAASSDSLVLNHFERFSFVLHTDILSHNQLLVYGPQIYSSPEYSVNPECNSIKIQIPYEEYFRYFESYYVKDQYAQVRGNTVYWNGDMYVGETHCSATKKRKRLTK